MARKRLSVRLVPVCTALLLIAGGCVPFFSPQAVSDVAILADIGATRQHLLVTNQNPFVWHHVTFVLNGSYRYQAEMVPRGSTSIMFSSFADDSGQAYTGTAAALRHVTIHVADSVEGRDGWFEW